MTAIGKPLDRTDGRAKVTGAGRYSAEVAVPRPAHALIVGARAASGRVRSIDTAEAEGATGVLAVLTHLNLPRIVQQPPLFPSLFGHPAPGETFFPMQGEAVYYHGQPVAVVVADTLDCAQHAATLVRVDYEETPATVTIEQGRDDTYEPEAIFGGLAPGRVQRGDVDAALAEAETTVEATYHLAANHHNPIEPSATTAVWDGGKLTLYDSTQGITATKLTVAALLGLQPADVRVITNYVGGGFGAKAMIWPHVTLAAMAARYVGRAVKLALTREQMFTSCGHREEQEHNVTLGADGDGRFTAFRQHKISPTSPFDDWAEPSLGMSAQLYGIPNFDGVYRLFRSNTMTPTFTRGPGETSGMFVLESAVDEMAYELGVDPLDLRLQNLSDTDPVSGQPWSSSGLKECYERGAEIFGWSRRNPKPGSHRDGDWLIGTGMATAAYPVPAFPGLQPQRARARMYSDGSVLVQCGTQEFGTGVGVAMTQVAADALGIEPEGVHFEYGDTDLPNAAAAVGSSGAGAISSAVHAAATNLRDQIIRQAVADENSPLQGADPDAVVARNGRLTLRDQPDTGESYGDILRRNMLEDIDVVGSWNPTGMDTGYAMATFGAQFAEVAVDADYGIVRVRRMVGVFAPGRILNRKMAHSQLMGGMIWGMSQALLDGTIMDPQFGRWENASMAEYLVPVNADAPDVEVDFVEVRDELVNPLGVKGVGEIGQVGVAAAVANAVFHATGRRVRELPIRLEYLL